MKKILGGLGVFLITFACSHAQTYTQQQVNTAIDVAISRFDTSTQLLKLNQTIPKIGKLQLANPPAETWDLLKKLENAIRIKINSLLLEKFEIPVRSLNTKEQNLLNEMNIYRNAQGLTSLALNTKLSQAAIILAEDMAKLDYFTHVSPEGVGYIQRLALVGYDFDYVSENLGQGDTNAALIVKLWSESPVHEVNLFNEKADEVGVAYTRDHYWVAVYASPID